MENENEVITQNENTEEQNGVLTDADMKRVEKLRAMVEASKKLGFVYRFDAISVLKKLAAEAKAAGSNGKSKGLNMAADAITRLRFVDAVRVTRCNKCNMWIPDDDTENCSTGKCKRTNCEAVSDGFCNWADGKKIGSATDNKQINELFKSVLKNGGQTSVLEKTEAKECSDSNE